MKPYVKPIRPTKDRWVLALIHRALSSFLFMYLLVGVVLAIYFAIKEPITVGEFVVCVIFGPPIALFAFFVWTGVIS